MEEYVAQLRQKPEHVRKRIALGASSGFVALVGLIWITSLSTSGAFALSTQPKDAIGSVASEGSYVLEGTNVKSSFSQLMGAVGAVTGATTTKPSITVIDGETSSTFDRATTSNQTATVIPF